jgi:2-dehydro-3-deoxyphosphogluconate aldolase / (4S)-4-hydroxy-2-oxoglutarate aldolase
MAAGVDGARAASEAAVVARLGATGIVAVVRAPESERALRLAERLIGAGLDVIEISFNTPEAASVIWRLCEAHPEALVGAGTVLRPDEARAAVAAGARYLLSPLFDADVDAAARDLDCPYIPGVFTARELGMALSAGRRLVKLFPASVLGVSGMRALVEPFGAVETLPTGGLGVADVAAWRAAGALAVGLGGALSRAADPAEAAREALAGARS